MRHVHLLPGFGFRISGFGFLWNDAPSSAFFKAQVASEVKVCPTPHTLHPTRNMESEHRRADGLAGYERPEHMRHVHLLAESPGGGGEAEGHFSFGRAARGEGFKGGRV